MSTVKLTQSQIVELFKSLKYYRVTSHYGDRIHPITKKKTFHHGIDVVKNHRDPINSFTDGLVVYARFGTSGSGYNGMGNTVAIKDKYGDHHLYAHLDSISVKEGQAVKKDQVVGLQGTTGQSTGSHLHYEIRKQGKLYNSYNPGERLKWILQEEEKQKVKVVKKPDVSEWAKGSVEWVKEKGIMTGFEDGTFRGTEPLTREQYAVSLKRYHDKYIKGGE